MRKGKYNLSKENKKSEIQEYIRSLDKDEQRAISVFIQTLNKDDLYSQIQSDYITLKKCSGKIEPLRKMLMAFDQLQAHLKTDSDDSFHFINMPSYARKPKTEQYVFYTKALRTEAGEYRKWFFSILPNKQEQKKEYIQSKPRENSLHFKLAKEVSDRLSKLWYINKVILYGSVSKGAEHANSDIDLAIEVPPQFKKATVTIKRVLDYYISEIAHEYQQKYPTIHKENLISILCLTFSSKSNLKMFKVSGFFDNSITLFQRPEYVFLYPDGNIRSNSIFAFLSCKDDFEKYYCFFEKEDISIGGHKYINSKVVRFEGLQPMYSAHITFAADTFVGCALKTQLSDIYNYVDHQVDVKEETFRLKHYLFDSMRYLL
ncbi:MAG TPA: nucleotidyltransferase domain-containing protein [Ruminiclostridium sp.]